jgi:hypothetical protein
VVQPLVTPGSQGEAIGRLAVAGIVVMMLPALPFGDFLAYPFFILTTWFHEVCNIASVLISRTVDGLCALLFPNHRTACCAISGRES